MEKINLVEILKDCPTGMELDCTMFEGLEFDGIILYNEYFPIRCRIKRPNGGYTVYNFTKYGCLSDVSYAKCVIFPKGKTTWEGFQRPFKDGDVVTWEDRGSLVACIYKERKNTASFNYHIALYKGVLGIVVNGEIALTDDELCLATEEEKQKLFDTIKADGYKWNPDTKTLEKLEKEKFDISTLKPFDKVLVRDNNTQKWTADLFSFFDKSNIYPYICVGHYTNQCIPFEGNQHLLGTTNNCDEDYKTWE